MLSGKQCFPETNKRQTTGWVVKSLEKVIKKISPDFKSLSFKPPSVVCHLARICHQGALYEKGKAEGRVKLSLESFCCSSHWGPPAPDSSIFAYTPL